MGTRSICRWCGVIFKSSTSVMTGGYCFRCYKRGRIRLISLNHLRDEISIEKAELEFLEAHKDYYESPLHPWQAIKRKMLRSDKLMRFIVPDDDKKENNSLLSGFAILRNGEILDAVLAPQAPRTTRAEKKTRTQSEIESDSKWEIKCIIRSHFCQRREEKEEVAELYFKSPLEVLRRHRRNIGDVPKDILSPFVWLWNKTGGSFESAKIDLEPTGKVAEIEKIITEELLALPELQKKLEEFVESKVQEFEESVKCELEGLTEGEQKRLKSNIDELIKKLKGPSEGLRELLILLVTGVVGKVISDQVSFSAAGVGSAAASTAYMSTAPWYGVLWAKIFGVPTYISVLGGVSGFAAAILAAPLILPIAEIAANQFLIDDKLDKIIDAAEGKSLDDGPDGIDVASKIAQFVQFLPDLLILLKKAREFSVS